jgi:hypothetical protein
MQVENLIIIIISLALGFLLGYFLAKQGSKSKRKPSTLNSLSDNNLENEVLKDQVKQLTAKIKTLEKALDMTK